MPRARGWRRTRRGRSAGASTEKQGVAPTLIETPRRWLMIDIDEWPLPSWGDLADDPETVIDHAIHELLPEQFHDVECWWQLSASAGFAAGMLKAHLVLLAIGARRQLAHQGGAAAARTRGRSQRRSTRRSRTSSPRPSSRADPIRSRGAPAGGRGGTGRRAAGADPRLARAAAGRGRPAAVGGLSGGLRARLRCWGMVKGGMGFMHRLRDATMQYARGCVRTSSRPRRGAAEGAAAAAIRAATVISASGARRGRTPVRRYYLERLIDGAFALLAADAGRYLDPAGTRGGAGHR